VTSSAVPLFPLRTVLFPDGPLPLRIFEPRYLDMISACMKNEKPFGVVLATPDSETVTGDTFSAHRIGTLATITDWYQGSDGILGITARGGSRFVVRSHQCQSDGLYVGEIELLPAEDAVALPAEFAPMAHLLEAIISDLGLLYNENDCRFDDASWVGYRFAEVLPISLDERQYCLEISDAVGRLEFLQPLLRSIRQDTSQ
jgi:Lon protease-like protein